MRAPEPYGDNNCLVTIVAGWVLFALLRISARGCAPVLSETNRPGAYSNILLPSRTKRWCERLMVQI